MNVCLMSKVDKYGRGSAAANGEGFVDLAPGDTFAALEAQLKQRVADRFDNPVLGISASIGSKRNASELAKHLASGEEEEAHKFAAKNVGVLFARGRLGVVHFDKKAVDETREKPKIFRVFSPFAFAGEPHVATITIKPADVGFGLYAIEALDIMRGERLEVHLAAEPRQFKTSRLLLADRIAYYVGDVNRTHPNFIGRTEPFTVNRTVELLENFLSSATNHQPLTTNHQPLTTNHQPPKFSIIVPVYNVAPYLRECLDSVLAQTFTDWEAICVDDGSTDGSGAILDEYKEKVERLGGDGQRTGKFVVIHQKNAGVSAARNAALDVANGEYVCFLDGDDMVRENWLQAIAGVLVENPGVDWIRIGHLAWQAGSILWRAVSPDAGLKIVGGAACEGLWQEVARWGMPFLNVCKKNAIGSVRFNPEIVCREDTLFCLEAAHGIQSLVVTDIAEYLYRQREGSAFLGGQSPDSALKFQLALNNIWRKHGGFAAAFTRLTSKNFIYWLRRCTCRTRRDVRNVLNAITEARSMGAFKIKTLGRSARMRWYAYCVTRIPCAFGWNVRSPIKSIFR